MELSYRDSVMFADKTRSRKPLHGTARRLSHTKTAWIMEGRMDRPVTVALTAHRGRQTTKVVLHRQPSQQRCLLAQSNDARASREFSQLVSWSVKPFYGICVTHLEHFLDEMPLGGVSSYQCSEAGVRLLVRWCKVQKCKPRARATKLGINQNDRPWPYRKWRKQLVPLGCPTVRPSPCMRQKWIAPKRHKIASRSEMGMWWSIFRSTPFSAGSKL